jgi:hypothetical protein
MAFLTLLIVLTQTISIGVVDEPLALANGTRLMPGDRVLAIHDSTHPWLTFLPSGEFLPLDSDRVIISSEWEPPYVELSKHPEAESGAWSEPDWQSQRRPWLAPVTRIYFQRAEFCYRDSSFWAKPIEWMVNGWFPLTKKEVLGTMSSFGPSSDSSRAKVLFDVANALRRGRRTLWLHEPPDSAQHRNAVRLLELSVGTSLRCGYREMAANALLTLVTIDIERRDTTAAIARCSRAVKQLAGAKSMFGRADAYATWQMMELAWRHNDTTRTRSLARKIILQYPDEVGRAVGFDERRPELSRSIWFDVEAAERLLKTKAGSEPQAAADAEFIMKSADIAVRYRGYGKLLQIRLQHSDGRGALAIARTALSLPHSSKLLTHPPISDDRFLDPENHDFKVEFIDSLDIWLPFDDLLQLYGSACVSGDTMASRDAARWLGKQIELGRTPPRTGLLDQVGPASGPEEFRRALLASITSTPRARTVAECTLYTRIPRGFWQQPRLVATQVLAKGSLVQPSVWLGGLIRVAASDWRSGWINGRALRGALIVRDVPAVQIAEPLANADFNGDGVRDLGLSTMDVLDGKALAAAHPVFRNGDWVTGFYRGKWVELRGDTLWLHGIEADTVGKIVPVARKAKKGVCKPGSCFYIAAEPGPNDPFAWVCAVQERGTVWTKPIWVGKGGVDAVYQVDSTLIIIRGDSTRLISAVDGALRGTVATPKSWKSWRGVFFNRSGYAVAEGDSIIYHDYSGSRELRVAVGKSDAKLFPPFAASFESDIWGVGRFGRPLCPVAAKAIPVVSLGQRPVVSLGRRHDGGRRRNDIAMHLISLMDGRELATVAMSENYYDCHYDEHGIYVSDDTGFRAITWEGKPLAVADLPLLSYPIWDSDRIVSYYSRPMGVMFEAGAASRLADAVRPLKSRWPAMDNRRESGE